MNIDNIDLTFLGTSSGAPTPTRNQQSLAVQLLGETWLFDCGEAAQHRMAATPLSPPGIKRIFISHLHGDHVFGLPGMLCAMALAYGGGTSKGDALGSASSNGPKVNGTQEVSESERPVVVYGPQGLRSFLRASLGNAYATLGGMKLQVHELVGLQAFDRLRMAPHCTVGRPLPCEVEGASIEAEGGVWRLPLGHNAPRLSVEAIELDHTVPTVGWVLTETPRPGKLDADAIVPLLKQHSVGLNLLRDFKLGVPIELPDGTVLQPSDYVEQPTQRKLAILSDMRGFKEPAVAEKVICGADLLVHEATNACTALDRAAGVKPADVHQSARRHGHSTPDMAGRLAKKVQAGHLVLTHFSQRYLGDESNHAVYTMNEMRHLARAGFKGPVTTAVDLMTARVHIDGTVRVSHPFYETASVPRCVPAGHQSPEPSLPQAYEPLTSTPPPSPTLAPTEHAEPSTLEQRLAKNALEQNALEQQLKRPTRRGVSSD